MIKLIAVIYWIGLLTLTHIPHLGPIPEIPGKDKTIHFVCYCIGTMLLVAAFIRKSQSRTNKSAEKTKKLANEENLKAERVSNGKYVIMLAWLAISIMILAMLDELTQPWVNRTCSLGDWLADTGGIILAVLINIYLLTKTTIYGNILNKRIKNRS